MVALALGIEIRPALAASHWQAGQSILEGLLEGEELENAFRHRRMETNAALIGPDRIVVLNAPSALDADIAVIVLPADAEGDHPVRLGDSPKDLVMVIWFLVGDEVENILGDFLHRLNKFSLSRIAFLHPLDERRQIDMIGNGHCFTPCVSDSNQATPLGGSFSSRNRPR